MYYVHWFAEVPEAGKKVQNNYDDQIPPQDSETDRLINECWLSFKESNMNLWKQERWEGDDDTLGHGIQHCFNQEEYFHNACITYKHVDLKSLLQDSEQIEQLDKSKLWSRALNGSYYLPGLVGLNKLKEADFANVVIQALVRVTPLRNYFLVPENYKHCKSSMVHHFGELVRKIWHPKNFKRQVNPHEFVQAVIRASDNRFQMGVKSSPVDFMSWLLDTLHLHLTSPNNNTSIITQCFQAQLEMIMSTDGLSENVFEIVSKSLAA